MKKQFLSVVFCLSLPVSAILSACSPAAHKINPQSSTAVTAYAGKLQFQPGSYKTVTITENGRSLTVRAFENIPYVSDPVEPDYQVMNIYIPEPYFHGGSINAYTADTAPIFFPNGVGGYMPAKPLSAGTKTGPDGRSQANSINAALMRGYVVASSGARGRTLGTDGRYTGKAPAVIVDLKSAVRYLKANDRLMPGRADRIISSGTSAGGAVSALLGASGGSADYHGELQKAGAVMDVGDEVFAVSAYCPITDLDHADAAYEWQFNGIHDYQKMDITMLDYQVKREYVRASLTDEQKRWSDELKAIFPSYINGLNLKGHDGKILVLDQDGNGTFKDEVVHYLNQSVNAAFAKGADLKGFDFLAQRKSSAPFYIADFNGYLNYLGRGKGVPAFDDVYLASGENSLFGNAGTDSRHFTEFGRKYGQGAVADMRTVKMMNAMNYVAGSPTRHWRIRHGAKDNDTSLAVSVILAAALANHGKNVDFAMPWGVGHSGDYDLDELFDWADGLVKAEP